MKWYTPALAARYTVLEVLAIHYRMTVASLKQLRLRENWRNITPIQPSEVPTAETISTDAIPPIPEKSGAVGPDHAKQILLGYWQSEDRSQYAKDRADALEVFPLSIKNVITGKTWEEIEPSIPRDPSFVFDRKNALSHRAIQQIRATWEKHGDLSGLQAALSRYFQTTPSHIKNITAWRKHADVAEDPGAVIPLEALPFKELVQRGAAHKRSTVTDEAFLEGLRLLHAGVPVSKIAKALKTSEPIIYKMRKGATRPHVWERFYRETGILPPGTKENEREPEVNLDNQEDHG